MALTIKTLAMKKITILLLFISNLGVCMNTTVSKKLISEIDQILDNKESIVQFNNSNIKSFKQVKIPFHYGTAGLTQSMQSELKDANIKHITYVYTLFTSIPDFDQHNLNQKRLLTLYNKVPVAFNAETEWDVFEQTGATSKEEAKSYFHGFIIDYQPRPTKESMRAEVKAMDHYLDSIFDTKSAKPYMYIKETSIVKPSKFADSKNESSFSETASSSLSDSTILIEIETPSGEIVAVNFISGYASTLPQDSTVTAVLNRHKEWNNMLIACDLTGSMWPYSTQLFVWHKLNFEKHKVQHFVFFNDGNSTPDNLKVAGKTGGIYHSTPSSFNQLKKDAQKCMMSGGGGDAPENDVEALLSGMNKCKDCNEIILIADNWANLRDYSFINQIDQPVKVILCGTQFGINEQYIELARKTGGSIHTMEEDITNLASMREGETIKIGKCKYKLQGGKFVKV